MRKGYTAEYEAKKELEKLFGKNNVFKLAIGQAVDFIVLKPKSGKIEKLVEVKKRKGKYWMSENKKQWERILAVSSEHNIPVELWERRRGRFVIKRITSINRTKDS